MIDKHIQAAVRFLKTDLANTLKDGPARLVLHTVALSHFSKTPLTVMAAMREMEGSPSTLHRQFKKLKDLGFILLTQSEDDNRLKFVTLTPKGIAYFVAIGASMLAVA